MLETLGDGEVNQRGRVSTLHQEALSALVHDTWWKGGKAGGSAMRGLELSLRLRVPAREGGQVG